MDDIKEYIEKLPSPGGRECCTKDIGLQTFSACLKSQPYHCRYAVLFGNEVFCSHPKHASYRKAEVELS
jgi:hypothetical protein